MSNRLSRPISRRELLKLMAASGAGLALSACKPQVVEVTKEVPVEVTTIVQATPAFPLEDGEIRILLCCSLPDDIENRQKWNTSFEASHPGVKIVQETVPAGQNYFEKLQTMIASDTMPDCFDMWEGYIQPYAANGVLLNMDPFFDADPLVSKTDLTPAAVEGGGWQDSIYAFCQGFMPGPISLFFNVDHFDAAGLAYPTSDWKWDDVRNAAQKLTKAPQQWGLTYSLWFVPWLYWIWSNGGDLFNADQTKCTLTEPAAYEALQYWADMVLKDQTTLPSSEQQALGGATNAFITGAVSMYIGNCWDIPELQAAREQGTINWKSVLSPKANNGNRIWYEHFWCWGIWAKTKRPHASWLMCRDFILDQVNQQAQPMVPPLKQLLPIFDTEQNRELGLTPLIDLAVEPGLLKIPGAGERFDKISQLVQAEIDLVFIGEKTAKEAAEAACPVVDEELARA